MKLKSYKLLFRIFSFLSDKTGGAPLFVRYKLLLGSLIIGFIGVSCNDKKSSYSIVPEKDDKDSIHASIPEKGEEDSVSLNKAKIALVPPAIGIEEPVVTCYDTTVTCYLPVMIEDSIPQQAPTEMVYGAVEIPPVSPEGDLTQFQKWVQNSVILPESIIENETQGRVVIKFIVDENGYISNISTIKSLSPDADAEAIRIISSSKAWIPGKHNGQEIRTSISLPVLFMPKNKSHETKIL
jgi:TonB family protein